MKRIWYSVCYYSKTIVLHQTFQSKVEAALCDHFWVRSKVITLTDEKAAYIEITHTNNLHFWVSNKNAMEKISWDLHRSNKLDEIGQWLD